MYQDQPADLIITHGIEIVRECETSPGETPAWAGHIAGVETPGVVLQALAHVVKGPWSTVGRPYEVWRHTGLTDAQRQAVAAEARKFLGRHYGWWKLFLQLGDHHLAWIVHWLTGREGELYAFRRLAFWDKAPICNLVWALAYQRGAGYLFGEDPFLTSPDDMRDWVLSHVEWEMVDRVEA